MLESSYATSGLPKNDNSPVHRTSGGSALVHPRLSIDCTVLINREIATSGSRFLRACRPCPHARRGSVYRRALRLGMRLVQR